MSEIKLQGNRAVVIIIGVYFVTWGKSKDPEKKEEVVEHEHIAEKDIHHSIKHDKEDGLEKISGHNVV